MTFQWDMLLLEAGFLAIFLPGGSPIIVWLFRWLTFRFMFLAGAAKIVSGDSTWRDLTALRYHFETQPLPTPLAWYAHQWTSWLLDAGVVVTLAVEMVVVFLIFLPRRPEIVIEGSNNQMRWAEYEFKYKPGALDRRPLAQKLDAGKMELQLAPSDLADVVREAVDTVMPSIEKNGNRLSQQVQTNELLAIDKTNVSQILMNLLSNAGKCTHQGEVTLIVEQTPTRLLIQVTDTGKGIPLDQQDRIFEWFRKVETSNATQYEGSGLGLAISKGFCELMGGTISVESHVNVGSTFTVVIPLPVTSTPDR